MAELIESQEEEFEAADITKADEPQQIAEETQDAVQQEEAPQQEENIPVKYKGKSLEDIIRMHQEAEKLIGRQAQEVGEVRQLADQLIKRQLDTKQEVPATKEDEIDFFEDPKKAVSKEIEKHPAIQQAKQSALELKKAQTLNRLQADFPQFKDIVSDPEFAQWITASPVRIKLYTAADSMYDYDAAAELLNTWTEIRTTKAQAAQATQAVSKEITNNNRKQAIKAATVDTGTVGAGSAKIYRRADLIRLQLEDPDRYYQLQDEIMAAYADGRVK